jgi:hypothetical protein
MGVSTTIFVMCKNCGKVHILLNTAVDLAVTQVKRGFLVRWVGKGIWQLPVGILGRWQASFVAGWAFVGAVLWSGKVGLVRAERNIFSNRNAAACCQVCLADHSLCMAG